MKPPSTISPEILKPKLTTSHSRTDAVIRISAPARLHLGFLDLNGSTGRKFGSIGLAVNSHQVIVEAQTSAKQSISIQNGDRSLNNRVHKIVQQFYQTLGVSIPTDQRNIALSIIETIPSHAGLGSGTQLAITIGSALSQCHRLDVNTDMIAHQLSRGARSGIGIASFDHGGFIVDGGLSADSSIPPMIARLNFPESWQIVLINDHGLQGVHGEQETQAFQQLDDFPLQHSHNICHLVLMQLLPAIKEQNIDHFGSAITHIQALIGDHFAPMQGGRYASQTVAALLNKAQQWGHHGIAQSSWGPTGCVFVESSDAAEKLVKQMTHHANQNKKAYSDVSFVITQANNSGADIGFITPR